jgi:hypothetical protein
MNRRLRSALLALAAALIVTPAAGASSFVAPVLLPVTNGNLWKSGTLYQGTMQAQSGGATMVQLSPVTLTTGSVQLGQARIATYACQAEDRKVSPATRALVKPFKPATCTLIGSKATAMSTKVQVAVPQTALGSYLSVLVTVSFLKRGVESTVSKWTEVPVYPTNPVSAGAPLATSRVYAGAPTSYRTRGWTVPIQTSPVGDATQAWVCPDKRPNTNADPLSAQGCNRVFNAPDATAGDQEFTLSGRIRKEYAEDQYLYYVDFTTIDPVGPLGELTYEIRSRGQLIKPIPAPKAVYVPVEDLTISAGFTGLEGVGYQISAHRAGSNRQFAQRCAAIGVAVNCQVTVLPGTWNVSIVPIGLKATGTPAKTQVTVTRSAPAS